MLTLGGEMSLWQPLLLDWVLWMGQSLRDVALRVHVDVPTVFNQPGRRRPGP